MYPHTLAFLVSATVVLALLSLLVRIRWTYTLDVAVTMTLQRWSGPVVDKLMRGLTWMGNSKTVVTLALACVVIAAVAKDLRAALFVALTLLAFPINIALKRVCSRERPGEREVKVHPGPRWGFSYPSGHTMGATAFFGFLAALISLHTQGAQSYASALALLPAAIGVSRIYMGAHWFSDVIGGMAAGAILILFLVVLYPV